MGHMQAGTNIAAEIFQVVFDISGIRIGIEIVIGCVQQKLNFHDVILLFFMILF